VIVVKNLLTTYERMFICKILNGSVIMGDMQEANSYYGLRELHYKY